MRNVVKNTVENTIGKNNNAPIKKTDSVMFDGYQIYHNYVKPHMGLNEKTPAEKCGIDVKAVNKWIL